MIIYVISSDAALHRWIYHSAKPRDIEATEDRLRRWLAIFSRDAERLRWKEYQRGKDGT